ncbi:MAG TPA: hypothetical protein VG604_04720 [Candidatus Saccharimonadales bacterium]|nr:hypothetical protein [Candidatus Saccharimonadales bacterium]
MTVESWAGGPKTTILQLTERQAGRIGLGDLKVAAENQARLYKPSGDAHVKAFVPHSQLEPEEYATPGQAAEDHTEFLGTKVIGNNHVSDESWNLHEGDQDA